MTRTDFESLAKVVRNSATDANNRFDLAQELARFCADSNQRFDHVRFFEACGVPNLWLANTDAVVVDVIRQIDEFDHKTNDDEYTDPGESWDLFVQIRDSLNDALPKSLQSKRPL